MEKEDLEVLPQLLVMLILVLFFAKITNIVSKIVRKIMIFINNIIFGPRKNNKN